MSRVTWPNRFISSPPGTNRSRPWPAAQLPTVAAPKCACTTSGPGVAVLRHEARARASDCFGSCRSAAHCGSAPAPVVPRSPRTPRLASSISRHHRAGVCPGVSPFEAWLGIVSRRRRHRRPHRTLLNTPGFLNQWPVGRIGRLPQLSFGISYSMRPNRSRRAFGKRRHHFCRSPAGFSSRVIGCRWVAEPKSDIRRLRRRGKVRFPAGRLHMVPTAELLRSLSRLRRWSKTQMNGVAGGADDESWRVERQQALYRLVQVGLDPRPMHLEARRFERRSTRP